MISIYHASQCWNPVNYKCIHSVNIISPASIWHTENKNRNKTFCQYAPLSNEGDEWKVNGGETNSRCIHLFPVCRILSFSPGRLMQQVETGLQNLHSSYASEVIRMQSAKDRWRQGPKEWLIRALLGEKLACSKRIQVWIQIIYMQM